MSSARGCRGEYRSAIILSSLTQCPIFQGRARVQRLRKGRATSRGQVGKVSDCLPFVLALARTLTRVTSFRLDILVNGAAGNFLAPASKLSSNGFKTVLMIDTVGTFNMSRAAYSALARPHLASTAPAVILNVTASLHRPATPMQIHASAAKAGVDSMTRTLALEWGPSGIRVVGVSPGPIAATEGMSKLGGPDPTAVLQQVPLGRAGSVDDVARAALFLVSDAANWVTGTTIDVDGGWVVNRTGFTAKL